MRSLAVTLTSADRAKRIVHSIRTRRWRKQWQRLHTPLAQLVAAVGVMVGGAALIGPWMVGVVLMLGGLLIAVDALMREAPAKPNVATTHQDVLERYRRAR